MNLRQYEKVQLIGSSLPNDNTIITVKDMLLMEKLWQSKYVSYSAKDKLLLLKGTIDIAEPRSF